MTRSGRALFVASALLAFCVHSCARSPESVKAPLLPETGKVRGRVLSEGLAVSLAGAKVRLGAEESMVKSDGTFILPGETPGKQSLVIEKRFGSGPVRRVLGVAIVYISENPVAVLVKARDATDVDVFCSDCHPPYKKVTRKDQVFRDIHVSGVPAKRALSDPSLLDATRRITCESCHTVHQPRGFPFFGIDNVRSGVFCNRCHGSIKP